MAKATTTIRQALSYQPAHSSYFAATKDLFNQVAAFYFEVITLHEQVLDLSNKEALTALEKLTHTTKDNPRPVMPLSCAIPADIPAMFRRAAIHAALGSAHAFYTQLEKWRKQKERARARGKKFTIRPPVPPRRWNRSVTLYAGQSMTSPFSGEACESWSLASRIDQTQPQSQPGRGSERLDWHRRGYDTTECCRSDPGVLPQHQALQLLA